MGLEPNPLGMKDLWPSASRFWKKRPGLETVNNPDPDCFRPQNHGLRTQNPRQTAHNPLLQEAALTKPTAPTPPGGPELGGIEYSLACP